MINIHEGRCDINGWKFRETCFKVLFEGMTVLGCMFVFFIHCGSTEDDYTNAVHWCLSPTLFLNFNLSTILYFSFDSEYFLMH